MGCWAAPLLRSAIYCRSAACLSGRRVQGQIDVADRYAAQARSDYQASGQLADAALYILYQSYTALQSGRLDDADTHVLDAGQRCDAVGAQWGAGQCNNQQGEIARARRQPEAARGFYVAAAEVQRTIGGETTFTPFNLALTDLELGDFEAALPGLLATRQIMTERRRRPHLAVVETALLACYANARDWMAFDEALAPAQGHLAATDYVDPDLVACARIAATVAKRAGKPRRAELARGLAAG
ncbi:MAG: hypothetical protein ACI9WU_000604 [Myxococcota bacterium]|jgi:hypothetical protein